MELRKLRTRSRRGVSCVTKRFKSSLTLVEIRQPSVVLSLVLFAVVIAALHGAEARRAFRTRLRVADFVAASLTYAELPAMRGLRMVALPLDNRDPGAAGS